MKFPAFSILCAAVFWMAGASGIRAAIIYNNLAPGGGPESSDKNFANIGRWAQQFTAGSGGSITNIKLNLYRRNTQAGTFDIQLWGGTGTTPSASLATLKTLDWEDIPLNNTATNTATFVEITSFANSYSLVAAEIYWIVLNQALNGPQAKRWTVTGSGGQTASFNYNTGQWTNRGTAANLGAQITVGESSAVPEPGQVAASAMVLAGVGVYWLVRRRRLAGALENAKCEMRNGEWGKRSQVGCPKLSA